MVCVWAARHGAKRLAAREFAQLKYLAEQADTQRYAKRWAGRLEARVVAEHVLATAWQSSQAEQADTQR